MIVLSRARAQPAQWRLTLAQMEARLAIDAHLAFTGWR
jgi:hypothetical protein